MKTGTSERSVSVLEGTLEGSGRCTVSLSKVGKTATATVFGDEFKNGFFVLKSCSFNFVSSNSFVLEKGGDVFVFNDVSEAFFKPLNASASGWGKEPTVSEAKMRDYMFANPEFVKSKIPVSESYANLNKEFVLDGYGRIDVLGKDGDEFVIIEFKKKRTTLGAIDQTRRYADHFESLGHLTKPFLFVRKITKEHEAYADEMGVTLVKF